MRNLLLSLLFLVSLSGMAHAWPQGYGWLQDTAILPGSTTLPSNCQTKQVFIKTDATSGAQVYVCINGTWVQQVGTGGGGGTPGGSATQLQYNNSGSFGGVTGSSVVGGNIGLGTATPGQVLDVNGTVRAKAFVAGTGTATITGDSNGNVGINQASPGKTLDVAGTLRSIGFTLSGNNAQNNYVLTSTDSAGDATWSPVGASSQWTTVNTNDVYLPNNGNVGIGTFLPKNLLDVQGTLSLKALNVNANGNVNIGTITSGNGILTIGALGQDIVTSVGNVGIGTTAAGSPLVVTGTGTISLTTTGNVGVGSANPGVLLDVAGSMRALGYTTNVGIGTSSTLAATSCLCKQYSFGICIVIGTCT